jgi:iron complex transport system substrate-binding protein
MIDMKSHGTHTQTRRTRWLLLLAGAALAISLVLASCATLNIEPPPSPEYLVDDLGRMVLIREGPQRIVSLSPASTEILFALGLGDRVVGVTEFCNYPLEALDKEKVGAFYPPDIEKIVALSPDLILASDIHRHEIIPALEERGLAVFALAPQTLEEVLESIAKAGRITGREEEAAGLVSSMRDRIEHIRRQTEGLEERPRVLYVTWHDPLWTVGRKTWIDDLIEIAGGANIFSPYFESGAMVEIEWVVLLNPDVIITSAWSLDWANEEPLLANTEARQQGRIYQSDDDLVQRPTPRLLDGLDWFAHFIHPEIFEEPEGR